MTFSCRVLGCPVAQGRPRAFKTPAGFVRVYDPETSRDWKRTVQSQVLSAWPRGTPPFDCAVTLDLVFHLPRPKSLPKRVVHHTKRPDLDNLAKAVKDAMRAIVYRDDSLVVELRVRKQFGDRPGVEIRIAAVEGALVELFGPAKAAESKNPATTEDWRNPEGWGTP